MMPVRIYFLLILPAFLSIGCYVPKSYTLEEYRTKSDLRIASVTKANGEKVFFWDDGGQYDAVLDRVHGLVTDDSEAAIPAQDIRLVNTLRQNPMMPLFEGMVIAGAVVVTLALIFVKPSPQPPW